MKNLIKITLSVFLLSALFLNVMTSKVSKSEDSFLGSIVVLNTALAEGGGDSVNCNCAFIWGSGCYADNWGSTCASGDNCSAGSGNCSL